MRGSAVRLVTIKVLLASTLVMSIPLAQADTSFVPHVIVGVPDSGINPYHQQFYRPELTEHPCTYIQGFPCSVEALELSVGVYSTYSQAYNADLSIWQDVEEGKWYWIPKTVFVAVSCENPTGLCILDENGHGTGTTSSVLTENTNALIAFKEGSSRIMPFLSGGIPVDIYSESWGNIVPIPGHPEVLCVNHQRAPIFVTAAGNDPRSTLVDCRKGDPALITVGGAYAANKTEEATATKQPEVVSYFCRPTAVYNSIADWRNSYCGTSFAAPTVAGALSKVVYAIRKTSGYTGGLQGDFLDPIMQITTQDLREAMNRTASYSPQPKYGNTSLTGVPADRAPWVQWGWGFYDELVANVTIEHILEIKEAPEKSEAARLYMGTVSAAKAALYGPQY